MSQSFIIPIWPVTSLFPSVRALSTTRAFGHAKADMAQNAERLGLPCVPPLLDQIHGTAVLDLDKPMTNDGDLKADAMITREPNKVCAVFHADCLPIVWYDPKTQGIAAIHAGWRSLCYGIIESTFKALGPSAEHSVGWTGPSIGPYAFEIGPEVRAEFIKQDPETALYFHEDKANQKYFGDLKQIARLKLKRLGFLEQHLVLSPHCTYTEHQDFFSFRRGDEGRMMTLIYREGNIQ